MLVCLDKEKNPDDFEVTRSLGQEVGQGAYMFYEHLLLMWIELGKVEETFKRSHG